MKMSRNEYAQLQNELNQIFDKHEVERITVNVDTYDGVGYVIECAPAEEQEDEETVH